MDNKILKYLFSFCLIGFGVLLNAQEMILQHQFYGVEEGLSHRDVQCIHQDKQGFMWFGTKYGLNRFDGYRFEWLTKEKNGLLSNEINGILEDSEGLMWLLDTESAKNQNINSVTLFDPTDHSVLSLEDKFGDELPFVPSDIIGHAQNEKGHLVFVSKKNQLIIYNGSWETLSVDLGYFSIFFRIHWASSGQFWITLEEKTGLHSLLVVDSQGGVRQRYQHAPTHYLYVYELDENGGGRFIQSYNDFIEKKKSVSFFYINPDGEQLIDSTSLLNKYEVDFSNLHAMGQIQESPHHHWVFNDYSQRKLQVIEKRTGHVVEQLTDEFPALEATNDMFLDNSQAVWIGTQFGVYRFSFKETLFKKYLNDQKQKGHGNLFACRQMTTDANGHLWVRVENPKTVWKIDLATHEERDAYQKYHDLPSLPLLTNTGYTILSTGKGDIIAAGNGYIVRFDPLTHASEKLDTRLSRRGIWSFHEDKYGKIWFHDQPHNEFGYIENSEVILLPDRLTETKNPYVYQYVEKENTDTIWLITSSGLFTFNVKANKLLDRYWSNGKGKYFFPFDNVHHLHQDDDGTCWLATSGNGIVQVNLSTDSIRVLGQYTRANGLPNNNVYAIYGDDFGNLWMSSDYGIAKFNKETKRFIGFTEKDGITLNEFNRVSHLQDEDGQIYFGGLNGITAFHPKDFQSDSLSINAVLAITGFEQFDGNQNKLIDKLGQLRQDHTITFYPDDRFFRLEFALLDYSGTTKGQYAYQVEGLDMDWNYQKENTLRFSKLPYGNHTLKIKGQTINGHWSDRELAIKIIVLKPFYLQTWFLVVSLLFLLASFWLFLKWRTRRLNQQKIALENEVVQRTKTIRQQSEELKSLEKLKSRFFANVSHELRTPLTLIAGPINSLLNRDSQNGTDRKLLQFAQRNTQQLQKLINEILDLSKLENNKLEVVEEAILFYQYLKNEMAQFHSAASSDNLTMRFEYEAGMDLNILLDKSKFEKIIHNYLSNALKFTERNGAVSLKVIEVDNDLQVCVTDAGKGIHPDDLPHVFDRFYQSKQADAKTEGGTGIGLSLVKELAELLGGKVWVESELGKGSVFYFRFPKKIVGSSNLVEIHPPTPLKGGQDPTQTVNVGQETKIEELLNQSTDGESILTISQKERSMSPLEGGKGGEKLTTILIVEDNPDLREYLQFLLSDYQVITAENGQAGLDCLQQTASCQLIISDLMMPVMDGYEFLENIKSDDRWRHIPTIMLTAKVNARAKLKALRIGVDDYLTKPFQEDELKARIKNLLRNYQERMALFSEIKKEQTENNEPDPPVIANVDAEWLMEVETVFTDHLSDSRLSVDFASNMLNLSERQFHRRLKQLTGLTPNQYIQEMRLQRAKDFLINGEFSTVKEVVSAIGLNDVRYFSKIFEKHFGAKPSEVRK